jgi:hypothetical protein
MVPFLGHGMVPTLFGSRKFEEWNGSIFCSVGAELRNGMIPFWLSSPLCCIRVNIPPVCSSSQIKKIGGTSIVFLAKINEQILSQAKHIYGSKRKTYRCI